MLVRLITAQATEAVEAVVTVTVAVCSDSKDASGEQVGLVELSMLVRLM
jgi:hypothetical protein